MMVESSSPTTVPRLFGFWSLILAITSCAQDADPKPIDWSAIRSPIVLRGDEVTAFRDPTPVYHRGEFWLYDTQITAKPDGRRYWHLGSARAETWFIGLDPSC